MTGNESALWQGARIGLLGGTFDPPHTGHVQMAQAARTTLDLDRVLFSVAPRPPHKDAAGTSDLAHRIEMVRLAIDGAPGLDITRIEEAHDVSFTVDLLRACSAKTRADLYFILGADSLAELHTWKDPEEILRLATLVVFSRDEFPPYLDIPGTAGMVVFESPRIDVSSTALRQSLAGGAAPSGSLVRAVADYAGRHRLYRGE